MHACMHAIYGVHNDSASACLHACYMCTTQMGRISMHMHIYCTYAAHGNSASACMHASYILMLRCSTNLLCSSSTNLGCSHVRARVPGKARESNQPQTGQARESNQPTGTEALYATHPTMRGWASVQGGSACSTATSPREYPLVLYKAWLLTKLATDLLNESLPIVG